MGRWGAVELPLAGGHWGKLRKPPEAWFTGDVCHHLPALDGHPLHSYGADLPAHTWRRNTNAVALSCDCQAAAAVARSWGWSADQIST